MIREVTTVTTKSKLIGDSHSNTKTKSVTETIIEKETTCDVSGAYTSVEEANKKVVMLQKDESEERKEFIKEVTDVDDGRVSWLLDTGMTYAPKDSYKIRLTDVETVRMLQGTCQYQNTRA